MTVLAGCAGVRTVESTVESYSELHAIAPGATYRFDRLPLQQADPAAQSTLEAWAAQALAKVGLLQSATGAHYLVRVGARVTRHDVFPYGYPYADPWPGWRQGIGVGGYYGRGGWGVWPAFGVGYYGVPAPAPRFQREVS